jgi:hypothetical protein
LEEIPIMRTDEKARLKEQKRQLLAEMRTLAKGPGGEPNA